MSAASRRREALAQKRILEDLIERAERELKRSFRSEIEKLQGKVTLAAIEEAIKARRKNVVDTELLRLTARVLAKVQTAQSIRASKTLSTKLVDNFDFKKPNTRAVKAMEKRERLYEVRFTQEQTKVIKKTIARGLVRGDNPRVIAVSIRDSIGLSDYESRIVDNYRRALQDGTSTRTYKLRDKRLDSGDRDKSLTQADINRLVARYRERRIDHRAEMIARRDAHTAVHEGAQNMWDKAEEDGAIESGEMVREWIATNDDRARPHHVVMDGQIRKLDQPFRSGLGNPLMYPGDISAPPEEIEGCRCTVAVVFK